MNCISIREFWNVRLLLGEHFATLAWGPGVRLLLLWEDNMAVIHALNTRLSHSTRMMTELRKAHRMVHYWGVHIQARVISYAVNRYPNRLSGLGMCPMED